MLSRKVSARSWRARR